MCSSLSIAFAGQMGHWAGRTPGGSLLNEKGEIVEWFGAATDVTARKEAEENYRQLAQTLDAQVRARTRELEA